jgi:hypothetical protein
LFANFTSFVPIMKKHSAPTASKVKKPTPPPANPAIVPDDRLGPGEPLDQANALAGEAPGVAARDEEAESSGHRVKNIEPDDEHNNDDLIEEGMQGYMHGSLTKPRKTNVSAHALPCQQRQGSQRDDGRILPATLQRRVDH